MQPTARLASLHQLPVGVRDSLSRSAIRGGITPFSTNISHAQTPNGLCRPYALILHQRRGITIKQLDSGRQDRERVVILGSGWAGYTVARQLDARKYQAVVVSPRSYFAFTPLLASTAVGTLEFRTALEPVRSKRTNVSFFQGWADSADFKRKTVTIEESVDDPTQGLAPTTDRHEGVSKEQREREKAQEAKKGQLFDLTYDKLIITVGCYSQTFGTPGVKEHALFLKDIGDARKIRNRLLACFEAAALPTTTDEMRKHLLNFAVVGGGPTGIEFSAELHDIIHEDLARIYPELMPFYKISVYDVAPKVLPMFDEKLAKYAMDTFKREGIAIKTNHHVQELRPGAPGENKAQDDRDHAVFTLKVKEEGDVGVGMVVWSTGLMQNPFIQKALDEVRPLPDSVKLIEQGPGKKTAEHWRIKKDAKTGSIMTDERLRVKLVAEGEESGKREAVVQDVYALGDCGILEGTAYPATAQVASQKAFWLAKRLNKDDIEQSSFSWKNLGVMAYIGNWNALVQGGGGAGNFTGRAAWVLWRGEPNSSLSFPSSPERRRLELTWNRRISHEKRVPEEQDPHPNLLVYQLAIWPRHQPFLERGVDGPSKTTSN